MQVQSFPGFLTDKNDGCYDDNGCEVGEVCIKGKCVQLPERRNKPRKSLHAIIIRLPITM
ncbi:hypothetical protein KUTeg_010518 [Tegillarca granosa]|uniref:Uncharacterized protein n=1 Tax=Tegillarca granosa TaxID=220873 RepID=A0ABQ9F5R2_TEGGR|nr:hypothetical protein KUTeg_010518 [Tegillarca granosa]